METPYYDPLRPNEYYYTPIQRVQALFDLEHARALEDERRLRHRRQAPDDAIPTVRMEDTTILSTVNIKPVITFIELNFPGKSFDDVKRNLEGRWGYVYNTASGKLILEVYFHVANPDGTINSQYRHFPVLPKSSKDNFLDINEPGWISITSAAIPIPIVRTDKANDLRCFLSPWRLNAECLATMEANGGEVIRRNFIPVCVEAALGTGLYAVCIDPFAWAHDAKEKYYDEALNAFLAGEADKDIRYRRLIAQTLKGISDRGDRYNLDNTRIFSKKPFLELDDLDREAKERKATLEQASAYMGATCFDGDDFQLAEQACLQGDIDGVEYMAVKWHGLLTGINVAEPGRQFVARLVADSRRFFLRQIYTPTPLFSLTRLVQNIGTSRWIWYACAGSVSETVVAYHRINIVKSLNKITEYQKLEKYLGEIGFLTISINDMTATNAALARSGLAGKTLSSAEREKIFEEVTKRAKVIDPITKGDLILAELRLIENADRQIDSKNPKIAEGVINYIFGTARGKASLEAAKDAIVGGKYIFDICNLLLAADALRTADDENSTNAMVSLLGSSSDFMALTLEAANAGKATANQQSVWGRLSWRATKGLGGTLGIISGFCDGYSMATEFKKGWSRDDAGRFVGASIGLVGAGLEIAGGVLVLAELYFGPAILAGSWAGPVGIAIGALAAAFLAAGAFIINGYSLNNPWQEFASHSYLGKRKDGDWVQYDWAPTGKLMPCETYDRTRRQYDEELTILLSLVTSYIVRLEKEFSPVKFSAGMPAVLSIEFPVSDPSHVVFIGIEQVWEWSGPDGSDSLTFTAKEIRVTREKEGISDVVGSDTLFLWSTESELTVDGPALTKINLDLQPNFVRESPGKAWQHLADLKPSAGRLYYEKTVRKVTVTVRVTSQTNVTRPYDDTYILPVFEFREFPRPNLATQSAYTWQLQRLPN